MRGRWIAAFVFGSGAALVLAMGLFVLASVIVRYHVGRQADRVITLFRHDASPWDWVLHRPRDLVAQRVFGSAELHASVHGLRLTSHGSGYQIGLPLQAPADLRRTSMLDVDMASHQPLHMRVVVRRRLASDECLAALPDAGPRHRWNLHELSWHHPDGLRCMVPTRAAMLRLDISQPAGQSLLLRRVVLRPRAGVPLPDPHRRIRLTPALPVIAQLDRILPLPADAPWPVLEAPATLSPQRLLAWRDATARHDPAAVLLPHGWQVATASKRTPAAPAFPVLRLVLTLAYAVVLTSLFWRRPPLPWRPWLDLAAALPGPLWVIVGLQITLPLHLLDVIPCVMGPAYAIAVGIRERDPGWHWWGPWQVWITALIALFPTAALVAAFGHAWMPPMTSHALAYLGWALLQQWLMLAFILRRLETGLGSPLVAVLACATLFALMHTPNARLMMLVFAAELFWAGCFLRWRAVVPIALAHAACALWVQAALSDTWLRSLEISGRYFLPS